MNRERHKARSVWIDISFSISIVLLTLSAIYLIFEMENDPIASQPDEKEMITASPIETEQIDSNYPGIKIITKTSNDQNAPFAIQYPQSIHNKFNKEVKDYIDEAQSRYMELMFEKKRVQTETTSELNISYETMPHASGNYSFVLVNSSSFSDAAIGKIEIRSFHLNPETGESFSIRDILDGDLNRLQTFSSLVRGAILQDKSLQAHLSHNEVERFTEPRWMNYRNFAITDEAIIIYYDENTIADSFVGPPIVSVPIHTIQDLLAAEFKPEAAEDVIAIPDQQSDGIINEVNHDEQNNETEGSLDTSLGKKSELPTSETTRKKVALTFDDGPDPKVTRQILKTLQKHEAKATFFMLGSRVEYYPDIVNELKEAGHELGNHTWTHADLTKLGPDRITKEINKTSAIIEEVTGQKVEAFRPPYGAVNDKVESTIGLPFVLWDVDTLDWKYRDPARILRVVKEKVKDGSIILMHDIHQSTADGLDDVLTYLKNEGYDFVTVRELEVAR
ncbi:polysaccharide deacetylase family protein [Sporosarcina sp. ACRSL]|uniref:polysaccharide deacetylase family protein n=1 Tax=Sporosarcina sp. ACRSL TaxID=2918215 RepID=UPI001EF59B7A|nr:polysaccharide deacetylase family protein [Sporosarcina sp. ACRSL]MCG7346072.1 polysaccharide deacetylase family protein [Sporosarcina sp. ACRSL]